jgi:hypothetical protein
MVLNQLSTVKYHMWNSKESLNFLSACAGMWKAGRWRPFTKGLFTTGQQETRTQAYVRTQVRSCTHARTHPHSLTHSLTKPVSGLRDTIFGLTYEVLRTSLRKHTFSLGAREYKPSQFSSNIAAGLAATIVSGPLNYARNMQYATKAHKVPPSIASSIVQLVSEASAQAGLRERLVLLQQRLGVGWGSARVALGMASGQLLFETVRGFLS